MGKLTREASYSIGGFHCLPKKDRNTWDSNYTVHVHYIYIQTVVKEVNKGYRCVTDPLSGESLHKNQEKYYHNHQTIMSPKK